MSTGEVYVISEDRFNNFKDRLLPNMLRHIPGMKKVIPLHKTNIQEADLKETNALINMSQIVSAEPE
jgi:hypothetical protein